MAATFAVIVVHASSGYVVFGDLGSPDWWAANVYDSLARWCVPVFVMISGALLLDPERSGGVAAFYRRRMSRIVIPLLFWSAFYLMWSSLRGALTGEPLSAGDLVQRVVYGRPYYHMWFLFMLVGLYAVAPFVERILRVSSRREASLFAVTALALAALEAVSTHAGMTGSELFVTWFLKYLGYFVLGRLILTAPRAPRRLVLWLMFATSVAAAAVGFYVLALEGGIYTGIYFYDYTSVTVIAMSISAFLLFRQWDAPERVCRAASRASPMTFGVYLIHPVFLGAFQYLEADSLGMSPVGSIPALSAIAFGLSLIAAWVILQVPYLRRIV